MRFIQICWILCKYSILSPFTAHRSQPLGRRLRFACEELGITFIKMGQLLSMRYDILPQKDCEELQQLLDNVQPIPFDHILHIIECQYRKPYTMIFRQFDARPIGSASVSQVHKAELLDGSVVAVKIKRPDVDYHFLNDIKILKRLARFGEFFSAILRHVQLREIVNQFEAWIIQDLDFVAEVRNMRRILEQYKFAQDGFRSDLSPGVFVSPFETLCTSTIIVMDFIDGIPMSHKEEILARPDYDIEKSIKSYVNAAIRNWFRDDTASYIYQADPHLSNILALPHGGAASIDCGLISELSRKDAQRCKDLIMAVYLKDLKKVVKIATEMASVSYEIYGPVLRPDLEHYLEQAPNEGFGFWFLEFARIMVKNKIKFPLFLTTFGRTNLVLDGLVKTYLPDKTTIDLVGEELRRHALKQSVNNLITADWLRLAYTIVEKIHCVPETLTTILNDPLGFLKEISQAIKTPA